jgi:hypothetical protein
MKDMKSKPKPKVVKPTQTMANMIPMQGSKSTVPNPVMKMGGKMGGKKC